MQMLILCNENKTADHLSFLGIYFSFVTVNHITNTSDVFALQGRFINTKMQIGSIGRNPTAWRALQKSLLDQIRL